MNLLKTNKQINSNVLALQCLLLIECYVASG